MAILFMGGERIDFVQFYNNTFGVDAEETFRTDYARASVRCQGSATDHMNYAFGRFAQSSSNFWFSAQMSCSVFDTLSSGFLTFLSFWDASAKRFGIQMDDRRRLRLVRYADGVTQSVLTTTDVVAIQNDGLHKIDVHMNYQTAGGVRVYVDQVLVLDFSGDVTAGGSLSLNGFGVSCFNNGNTRSTYWSEMVAVERDTRTISLKTHAPTSTKEDSAWIGTHEDIDETFADDGDVITTTALDAVAKFGVNPLPTNNLSVRGFKLSARVSRGPAGPAHVALGVTSGTESTFSEDFVVDTGWNTVSTIFETNPETEASWTEAEINAIEIDLKSRT